MAGVHEDLAGSAADEAVVHGAAHVDLHGLVGLVEGEIAWVNCAIEEEHHFSAGSASVRIRPGGAVFVRHTSQEYRGLPGSGGGIGVHQAAIMGPKGSGNGSKRQR